jgi:hypothetical protein
VMEDDDRTLFDRQTAERPIELVAIGETAGAVCLIRLHRDDADVRDERPLATSLVVAGPKEQPVEPRVEAGCVAELRQVSPRLEKGRLDRVLGPTAIVDDANGDGMEAIDRGRRERPERVAITIPRPLDEIQHWLSTPADPALSQGMAARRVQTFTYHSEWLQTGGCAVIGRSRGHPRIAGELS